MVKRLFRPLGKRLQRFARLRINNFSPMTNTAARTAAPPVWEEASDEPLVWQSPVGMAVSEPEPALEPEIEPETDFGDRRTPPDLALILELHEQRRQQEGELEPPSPFRPAGTSPATIPGAPVQRPPSARTQPVQRSSAQPNAPANLPRRGRVISEVTPTSSQTDPTTGETFQPEETPEWEADFDNQPPPDRPDLAARCIEGKSEARRLDQGDRAEFEAAQMVRPRPGEVGRVPQTLSSRIGRKP